MAVIRTFFGSDKGVHMEKFHGGQVHVPTLRYVNIIL